MIEILKYISNGLIIISFLIYLILVLINKKKIITKSIGFNITKDILQEYNSINIVENKSYFTFYNLKRKVIKISSKCYYGSSISDISIPLIETGISAIDDYKNKTINILRNVISNLKILYLLPLIAIIINDITYNINDAKVSIAIISLFIVVNYLFINIINEAFVWVDKNIKKIDSINKNNQIIILKFINNILVLNKVIFISELLMIIRFVAIILKL